MNRKKWIIWIVIQVILGALIIILSNGNLLPSNILSAFLFFYFGFSLITTILVGYILYSEKATSASQKGGRVWGGFLVKFMLLLILLVVYLAIGGFKTDEEGMAVILLYIIYGWLMYYLAVD